MTIDGEPLKLGKRRVWRFGPPGAANGVYQVTKLGDAETPFVLTRHHRTAYSGHLTKFEIKLLLVLVLGTLAGLLFLVG